MSILPPVATANEPMSMGTTSKPKIEDKKALIRQIDNMNVAQMKKELLQAKLAMGDTDKVIRNLQTDITDDSRYLKQQISEL